jgi:hypothetical protein
MYGDYMYGYNPIRDTRGGALASLTRLASRDRGQAREQVLVRGLLEVRGENDLT